MESEVWPADGTVFQADRVACAKVATQKRLTWLLKEAYTYVGWAHKHTVGAGQWAAGGDEGDNQRRSSETQTGLRVRAPELVCRESQ